MRTAQQLTGKSSLPIPGMYLQHSVQLMKPHATADATLFLQDCILEHPSFLIDRGLN